MEILYNSSGLTAYIVGHGTNCEVEIDLWADGTMYIHMDDGNYYGNSLWGKMLQYDLCALMALCSEVYPKVE